MLYDAFDRHVRFHGAVAGDEDGSTSRQILTRARSGSRCRQIIPQQNMKIVQMPVPRAASAGAKRCTGICAARCTTKRQKAKVQNENGKIKIDDIDHVRPPRQEDVQAAGRRRCTTTRHKKIGARPACCGRLLAGSRFRRHEHTSSAKDRRSPCTPTSPARVRRTNDLYGLAALTARIDVTMSRTFRRPPASFLVHIDYTKRCTSPCTSYKKMYQQDKKRSKEKDKRKMYKNKR